MPDSGVLPASLSAPAERPARRPWVSPLMRRILLVNALPLALLVAALLYLDQYQNGLLEAEVVSLREQARIYAGALGESAVRGDKPNELRLVPALARPLLRRLTEPTPNADAKIYGPDGTIIADSRVVRAGQGGTPAFQPLPPPRPRSPLVGGVGAVYDALLSLLPRKVSPPVMEVPSGPGIDWQPDVKSQLRTSSTDQSREMPPYIRRTNDNRLLITVAEPVQRDRHTVGIVLLTRDAREVDLSLFQVRASILGLFILALGLTVMLSYYLSLTIARPILWLAGAAVAMREGKGRAGTVPAALLRRHDEIGELAHALADLGARAVGADGRDRALRGRCRARDQEPAVVDSKCDRDAASDRGCWPAAPPAGHHRRGRDPAGSPDQRHQRCKPGGCRTVAHGGRAGGRGADPGDAAPRSTTRRGRRTTHVVVDAPPTGLVVQAVEYRLVQVLRNLIANAMGFSPRKGRVTLRARAIGAIVEISVEDEGPGIPEANLEHIFERFYSERPKGERFGQHSGLGLSISRQIVEALKGPHRGGEPAGQHGAGARGALCGAAAARVSLLSRIAHYVVRRRFLHFTLRRPPSLGFRVVATLGLLRCGPRAVPLRVNRNFGLERRESVWIRNCPAYAGGLDGLASWSNLSQDLRDRVLVADTLTARQSCS